MKTTERPPERLAVVRCSYLAADGTRTGCQRYFEVSARSARAMRAGERQPRCQSCRLIDLSTLVKVTQEHRDFWLDNYTWEEIVELAEALFGPLLSKRPERLLGAPPAALEAHRL